MDAPSSHAIAHPSATAQSRPAPAPREHQHSLIIADGLCPKIAELLPAARHDAVSLPQHPHPLLAIASALQDRRLADKPVETLHIVAHGRAGAFQIGGQWISAAALITHAAELAQWQVRTIALWSCNVGADRNFVALLEELTGAKVWASSQRIGRIGQTNNWQLASDSNSETPSAPWNAAALQGWAHHLANYQFVNAYRMVYDLNNNGLIEGNRGETAAEKEQSTHNFNATGLGPVRIEDGSGSRLFSGNDVSAASIVIGGDTYYGWISRPIKANGIVRGFYFWTDPDFTTLALAQADGNQDGDANANDNIGFILVVDQAWFDAQIAATARTTTVDIDGVPGQRNYSSVGSSSDRVDSALNGLLGPNSVTANPDALTINEGSGPATGNLLTNDSDVNNDTFSVTSFSIQGLAGPFVLGQPTNIPGIGTLTLSANGSYTFTPEANFNGPVPPITYQITDTWGATSSSTFSIAVNAVNDPPVATGESQSVPEDSPATGNVLANDIDPDGDQLTITGFSIAGQTGPFTVGTAYAITGVGSFTLNTNGSYVFVPVANYNGSVPAVTYTVSDGTATATAALNLTITPVNDAPVASPDNASGTSFATAPNCVGGVDSPAVTQTGNVITNDTDPDITVVGGVTHRVTAVRSELGATLSGTTVTGRYGTLTINPDGSYSYAVDASNAAVQALTSAQSLSETFTYTISEIGTTPTLLSASSTLRIVINGGNDEPVARDDADAVNELNASQITDGITNFGTASATVLTNSVGGVLLNDSDAEGTTLSVSQITTSGSASGSFASASTGGTTLTLAFTGTPSQLDTTFFVYWLNTGLTDTTPQLLYSDAAGTTPLRPTSVTGNGSNRTVSIASSQVYYESTTPGVFTALTLQNSDVLGFDNVSSSPSGSNYYLATITAAPIPSGGATFNAVTVNSGLIALGMSVTGTDTSNPANTFSGTVSNITFDASGSTVTGFTIDTTSTVAAVNYNFSFTGTSAAGTSINGQYGTLILESDGTYTYYLTSNALGPNVPFTERFTYTATDGSCTDTAVLSINITGTPISLADTSRSANEDELNSGTVPTGGGNLTGFSWDGVSITVPPSGSQTIVRPGIGSLEMFSDGRFTFTPEPNYAGPVPSAIYTANGAAATLALAITPLNDAPAGTDKTISINDNQTYTITAADFGFSDPNDTPANDFASVILTTINTTGGTLTLSGVPVSAGTEILVSQLPNLVFTPSANGVSDPQVVIGFQVRDNGSGTGSNVNLDPLANTLTITASRVNDAPVNTLPATLSTNSYTPITFGTLGTVISVADPDAGDGVRDISTVVLDVSNGALTVTPGAGVNVSGNGSGLLTLTSTGTQAQLQAVLASLVYQPSATFSGTDQLVMTTTDKGGLFDVDSRDISVAPDNRAVSVTGTIVNEASPWVLFEVDATAIGQRVSLELGQTSNPSGNATSGLDFLPNLEYFNGTAWVAYPGGLIEIPATVEGGGPNTNALLLVRTAVVQDTTFESTSATFESLQLTARNVADTLASGPGATGVSQIRDDGQGSIYLGNNNTFTPNAPGSTDPGGPDYPAELDDDRPLAVTSVEVNEGSPYALFTVTGAANQLATLTLGGQNGDGDDLVDLEYFNGANWQTYTSGTVSLGASGSLLVRVALSPEQEDDVDGPETFNLIATNTGGTAATGVGTIVDDGTGTKWSFSGLTDPGTPAVGPGLGFDDDRVLAINSVTVNEGSKYAVFQLTGTEGQLALLSLSGASGNGSPDPAGGAADLRSGGNLPTIQYLSGTTWTNYDPLNPPALPAGGTLKVRVDISAEQDPGVDGPETFKLVATTTGGTVSTGGNATINDDGTGDYFAANNNTGTPALPPGVVLDDDRTLNVTGSDVNEASPYVRWTVKGADGQTVFLSLGAPGDSATPGADTGTQLQVLVDGNWVNYNPTQPPNIPAGGELLVRVAVNNDSTFEGREVLTLLATSTGGNSASGSSSISDDGSGSVFLPGNTSNTPNTPGDLGFPARLDDDRAVLATTLAPNTDSSQIGDRSTANGFATMQLVAPPGLGDRFSLQGPDGKPLLNGSHYRVREVRIDNEQSAYEIQLLDAAPGKAGNQAFGRYYQGASTGNNANSTDGTYTVLYNGAAIDSFTIRTRPLSARQRIQCLDALLGDNRSLESVLYGHRVEQPKGTKGDDVLTGNSLSNTLKGLRGRDLLNGVGNRLAGDQITQANLREVDILIGGKHADTFQLGDIAGCFYDQGGNGNYALIKDFGKGDTVLLRGSASDYSLERRLQLDGQSGIGLYVGRGPDRDLVALIQGNAASSLDLSNANQVTFF